MMNENEKQLWRQAVLNAFAQLKQKSWDVRNSSTKYDVVFEGLNYPPKQVFGLAATEIADTYPDIKVPTLGGGEPTNNFIRNLGFEVRLRSANDPISEILARYKTKLRTSGLENELYKWQAVQKFRGRPNLDASDFSQEITSIKFYNLVYGVGIGVIYELAKNAPNEYKTVMRNLFAGQEELSTRVQRFDAEVMALYRKINTQHPHHHDERTIATLLTYYQPEKYTFFKDSFYQKYCKMIGEKAAEKGFKYEHYLSLVEDLVENYIRKDSELLELVKAALPADAFADDNHQILAQDILFNQLDQGLEELDLEGFSVYKVSMGAFSNEEILKCIEEGVVIVHPETLAKGRTAESQGERFLHMQVGDYFYLTHGNHEPGPVKLFGRITSAPRAARITRNNDPKWLERSFEPICFSINQTKYKGTSKWWVPSDNSTCIRVPYEELEQANKLIFTPYFQLQLKSSITAKPELPSKVPMKLPNMNHQPLNQILYGPPGTGKTYHTINKALEIIADEEVRTLNWDDRAQVKALFDKKMKVGQIVFTTFHQSMSYEDFVEGIKPLEPEKEDDHVIYKVEPGVFKRLCVESSFEIAKVGMSKETEVALDFSNLYDLFIDEVEEQLSKEEEVKLKTRQEGTILIDSISQKGNIQVKHSKTGRLYTVSKARLTKLNSAIKDLSKVSNINDEFREVIGGNNSSAYWAVLNDIKQIKNTVNVRLEEKSYTFPDKVEVVGQMTKDDYRNAAAKNFVLVIDEINRGNVSQIFGELITLLEADKRLGRDEALEVTLPYSKEKFGVPANLYIVGTMNTADRSVEALDTALRRRFSFTEMPPNYELKELEYSFGDATGKQILKTINQRIEKLLDRDHLIGHSYLMVKKDEKAESKLMDAFYRNIIPLLQEYFYGDYAKIGAVLGKGFIDKKADADKIEFADFDYFEAADFADKVIYEIIDHRKAATPAESFEKAIRTLMNPKK